MLGEVMKVFKDRRFIVSMFTAIGAFGGFPTPPAFVANLLQNKVVQFLVLWILIAQGGGGMDLKFAGVMAAIFYGVNELLKNMEAKGTI